MNKIKIDLMKYEDLDGIMEAELSSFSVPWSRKMFEDELSNRLAVYFTAHIDNRVVGYVGMWEIAGEGDITNICVLPEFRRMGIGKALMKKLFDEAVKRKLRLLTLEVRESNAAARKLYELYGFKDVGMRKNYYADNRENAVIMTAYITNIYGNDHFSNED